MKVIIINDDGISQTFVPEVLETTAVEEIAVVDQTVPQEVVATDGDTTNLVIENNVSTTTAE